MLNLDKCDYEFDVLFWRLYTESNNLERRH